MTPLGDKIPRRTSITTGVLVVTIATYFTYAIGLLSNAIVARALVPADFGRYSYVVWLCGWLVLLINNGLTTSGIRFVAELLGRDSLPAAQRAHGYLSRLSHYSEGLVLIGFAALAWIIRPAEWRSAMPVFVGVILVSALAKSRYLFDISIAKGYGQFQVEPYSSVGVGCFTMLIWVALYLLHAPLIAFVVVFGISSLAFPLAAALQLRRAGVVPAAGPLEPEILTRLRRHLRWTMLLAGVAVFANKSIEVFFLNAWRGPTDVGFFTIGAALTRGGIDLLTSGLMTVLMPLMSNAFGRGGEEQVNRIFSDSVRLFAFAGLLAAGVGFFLAMPTVELLYGPSYLRAVPAFQVMVLVSGLTLGDGALGALLSTTDRQRSRAVLVALQVVITIVFAAALIPAFGLPGAVAAHAGSRLLGFALTFGWVTRTHSAQPPFGQLLRLVLAAAAAGTGAWISGRVFPGLTGCVLAAVVYGLLLPSISLLARCWTKADFKWFAHALQSFVPKAVRLHRLIVDLGTRLAVDR
jgi:O-antigen/teichoic acid export membrane protein